MVKEMEALKGYLENNCKDKDSGKDKVNMIF
jgi:hypothetical protein